MHTVPGWFIFRNQFLHACSWPKRKLGPRLYNGAIGAFGLGSICLMAKYLCDSLDRSSSIARQTLLNLRGDRECQLLLGSGPLVIEGGLDGDLNQIAGHANVQFTVFNPSSGQRGQVHVQAKRHYLNWQTQLLEVVGSEGKKIKIQ